MEEHQITFSRLEKKKFSLVEHCDSDYFPIIVLDPSIQLLINETTSKWILNKANWPLWTYLTSDTRNILPTHSLDHDINQTAKVPIPKPLPSPKNRNSALNHFKKTNDTAHLIFLLLRPHWSWLDYVAWDIRVTS